MKRGVAECRSFGKRLNFWRMITAYSKSVYEIKNINGEHSEKDCVI